MHQWTHFRHNNIVERVSLNDDFVYDKDSAFTINCTNLFSPGSRTNAKKKGRLISDSCISTVRVRQSSYARIFHKCTTLDVNYTLPCVDLKRIDDVCQ